MFSAFENKNAQTKKDIKHLFHALERKEIFDPDDIMEIFKKRTLKERLNIAYAYKMKYDEDLSEVLAAKTTKIDFLLLNSLIIPTIQLYAGQIRRIIEARYYGSTSFLSEMFLSIPQAHFPSVMKLYEEKYNSNFEEDVLRNTSGRYRTLVSSIIKGERNNSTKVDKKLAKSDAYVLEKSLSKEPKNMDAVQEIFINRNYKQLKETFDIYKKETQVSVAKSLLSEFIGEPDAREIYIMIAKMCCDEKKFLMERLHTILTGTWIMEDQLMRIILTRKEIDLEDVAKMYDKTYGITLKETLKAKISSPEFAYLLGQLL